MTVHRPGHIDRATAEALLRGDPEVRRHAVRLSAYLAAAAAPARPHELAGLPAALEAYRAAGRHPVPPRQRKGWLARVLTIKVGLLLAATTAGGVALATTTGTLPLPLSRPAPVAPTSVPSSPRPAVAPRPVVVSARPSPSLLGLCRAYATDHGKSLDSPTFTGLASAAGGPDRVDAFCAALLASPVDASPSAARPDHPTEPPSDHPSGKGGDHGTGPPSGHPPHPSH
jgi:hypothetical protein